MEDDRLVRDPVTQAHLSSGSLPDHWRQRRLYVGKPAARQWRAVGAEQNHRRPVGRIEEALFGAQRAGWRGLAAAVLRAAGSADWRCLVSLGPGDARTDLDLVGARAEAGSPPTYVAVDLNEELLRSAARKLEPVAAQVLGILGDFEDRLAFLADEVRARTEGPRLTTLLGNTLGNLDRGERSFLSAATALQDHRDGLLISCAIKGPQWTLAEDPHLRAEGYPGRVQRFLCAGLQSAGNGARPVRFDSAVRFEPGSSDVPGACSVDLVEVGAENAFFHVTRYDWDALLLWLESAFPLEVVFTERVEFDPTQGAGVVLVRRRA